MSSLIEMGQRAKDAAVVLATLSTPAKNKAFCGCPACGKGRDSGEK